MGKNKEWFLNELGVVLYSLHLADEVSANSLGIVHDETLKLLDQLEEPKKAILPPFVANIIREGKATGKTFANITGNSSIRHWLIQKVDGKWKYFPEREEELMRAWVNGMEEEL